MTEPDSGNEWALRRVTLDLCEGCISGQGGQCHTAGCIFWIHDMDAIPLDRERIVFHQPPEPADPYDDERFK